MIILTLSAFPGDLLICQHAISILLLFDILLPPKRATSPSRTLLLKTFIQTLKAQDNCIVRRKRQTASHATPKKAPQWSVSTGFKLSPKQNTWVTQWVIACYSQMTGKTEKKKELAGASGATKRIGRHPTVKWEVSKDKSSDGFHFTQSPSHWRLKVFWVMAQFCFHLSTNIVVARW